MTCLAKRAVTFAAEPSTAHPTRSSDLDSTIIARLRETLGSLCLADVLDHFALELLDRCRAFFSALADRDLPRASCELHRLRIASNALGAAAISSAAQDVQGQISRDRSSPFPAEALKSLMDAVGTTRKAVAEQSRAERGAAMSKVSSHPYRRPFQAGARPL